MSFQPYTVQEHKDKHGSHRGYLVLDPEGNTIEWLISSYPQGDKEKAEKLAEMLTAAFQKGYFLARQDFEQIEAARGEI